jgi:hypothetical protein
MYKGFIKLLIIILLVVPFSFLGCRKGESNTNAAEKTYSLKQLQEDFLQLRKTIEDKHPNLYLSKSDLNNLFNKQYNHLKDGMTELQFYRVVSPAISALGCGHTNIYVSKSYEEYLKQNGKYLPLSVNVIEKRLFVNKNLTSVDIPAGSEILSINGRKSSEIIAILLNNLTADGFNQTKKYYILNHWFNGVYYYFIENPGNFEIEYSKPGKDGMLKVSVPAIRDSSMDMTTMNIYFCRMEEKPYFGEIHENYAKLNLGSFQTSKIKMGQYKKYLHDFFADVKAKHIENLVVDLRGNWGGSPTPAAHLFSYLIEKPTTYFERTMIFYAGLKRPVKPSENRYTDKVYILTDGGCFSTAGHFASLMKYHNIGKFVGEESGGSAVVTDGGKNLTLKNTKLRIYYATTVFKTAAYGLPEGRGVIPDYEVKFTMEDYLNNKDPQLQKVVELINR